MSDERREALNKAFDEVAAAEDEEDTGALVASEESGGSEENTEEPVRVEETEEEGVVASAEEDEPKADPEAKSDDEPGEEEPAAVELKAPQGWNAKVREQWGKLPADVKEEINRREASFAQGIQKYAEAGKFGQTMRDTLAPFAQVIAMEGVDEATAVKSLATQAATMRLGTSAQKAQTVVDIIQAYDVDIGALDNLLVGEPLMTPEQQQFQTALDSRLAPLEQLLQQANQSQQTHNQTAADNVNNEISTFENDPKNEFIADVREDMADILEMSAKRGQKMTLQQAYDKAVTLNPATAEVVEARANRDRIAAAKTKLSGKKAASASVAGSIGSNQQPTPVDRRDAISQAWEAHSG